MSRIAMRTTIAAFLAVLMSDTPAAASPLPAGWHMDGDTAVHDDSGMTCPDAVGDFERLSIDPGAEPALGTCRYSDGRNKAEIRVRRYVRGGGETPLAVKNDQVLIEPKTDEERAAVAGMRMTPAEDDNGREISRFIITVKRGALLIDCEAQTLSEDGFTDAANAFTGACFADE